jgi:phenylacetyl-CoA:acceptor oxidoreductase 27-kDa subunit
MTERWGMAIDLNRCVGCQTCTAACKHHNDTTPGIQWRRVLDVEHGRFPDVQRLFLVVGCQHCANPPCVPVCPTGATRQRADGLVTMNYDRCIGCGSCAVACPYQARTIAHDERWYYGTETLQERRVIHEDRLGVAQKCTFCIDKVDEAKARNRTPGVDLDLTPACAASCIASAIHFGDFNDPNSNVSLLVQDNANFQMHEELGTDPQIRYLYEAPAIPGRNNDESESADDEIAAPLAGKRQTFWDFRAAMNFTMGGFGTGLAIIAYLSHLLTGLSDATLTYLYAVSAVVVAVGLFFVFLEIGRKLRFALVMLRPQSSWMTREVYFAGVFYSAVLADLIWRLEVIHLIVALGAGGFLYCQAQILFAGKGIPAWRVALIPKMLIATALFEGTALVALATALFPEDVPFSVWVAVAGLALAALNALLWWRYRATAKTEGIGLAARRTLAKITPWLHGIGHAAAFVLFLGAVLVDEWTMWLALAGIAALAGGAAWKFTIVVFASYQQGYSVPRLPQRGSGTRAAPIRQKGPQPVEYQIPST